MPLPIHPKNAEASKNSYPITPASLSWRQMRKNSLQARWDRFWKDHEPTPLQRHRHHWVFSMLKTLPFKGKGLVLGCGDGLWNERLLAFEWESLEGCDVSKIAIQKAKQRQGDPQNITRYHHECFPFTKLAQRSYDWVFAIDLIAEIEPNLRRLGSSELARLCKRDGYAVIATALDRSSFDALEQLVKLLQTELEILDIYVRYDQWDVFLEKGAQRWKGLNRWMNRWFFKCLRPGYTVIIAKPKSLI
jgi:SAM-dependent methyltransferase